MNTASIDLPERATAVVEAAGLHGADVHGSGRALAEAAARLGPRHNHGIAFRAAGELELPAPELFAAKCYRRFSALPSSAALPPGFAPG